MRAGGARSAPSLFMIYLLLIATGVFAGFVNTLAGGGSVLVMPILITLGGMEATVANATNRVAILLQNSSAVYGFHRAGKIDLRGKAWPIAASVAGAAVGTCMALRVSNRLFEVLLAVILIFVVVMMVLPRRQVRTRRVHPVVETLIFLGIGFYGGFIQVGIGLILLAALNLIESYDLVQANAYKVTVIFLYTVLSVIIFAFSGKIMWHYALILSTGNVVGSWLGVRFAIKKGEKVIKVALVVAAVLASLKLLGLIDLALSFLGP